MGILRSLVDTGTFGALTSARIEFGRPGLVTGGRYSGNLAMAGGGVLFEVGVHPSGLRARGTGRDGCGRRARPDGAPRGLRHPHRGAPILTLCGSIARRCRSELLVTNLRFTRMVVELDFENAQASVQIFGDNQVRVRSRKGDASFSLLDAQDGYPRTSSQYFAAFWRAFLNGIGAGIPNLTSAACLA